MTKKETTKGRPAATYGRTVTAPPGTLSWPSLHEMKEGKFGRRYTANLRWDSEDDLQQNTKVYDKFMDAVYEVAAEHWGMSTDEARQAFDEGTIESPFNELEGKDGSRFVELSAQIKERPADAKYPQKHPICKKLVGKDAVMVPVAEVEDTFYPGSYCTMSVQVYATKKVDQETDQVKRIVRCYLVGVLFIRDGKRLGGTTTDMSREDIDDIVGSEGTAVAGETVTS